MSVEVSPPRAPILDRLVSLAPDAFGLSEPAIDGVADPRGPQLVQFTVAGSAIVIHAGMFVYTGAAAFLWVAFLTAVYILVGIPLTHRLATMSPESATWGDLASMMVLAVVLGDPAALLAWFPLVVFANVLYASTRTAVRDAALMVGLAAAFYIVMSRVSGRLFEPEVLRVYLGATLLMWLAVTSVYALSVGGSVNRRSAAVEVALAQRDVAEMRARSEASRLRVVLEEAPIGLLLQGSDGRFSYGNGPALEMLGVTLAELQTTGAATAMDSHTRDRVEAEVSAAREAGKAFFVEHETLANRVLELRGRHVEFDDGFTTVTTLRDLTPEREAHRHIARLRTLVENSETHMVVWAPDGEIVIGNRVFRDMWAGGEPVLGRSVIEIVGEQIRPFVEMPRLDGERTFERPLVVPDGQVLWISMSTIDFQDPFDGTWLRSVSARDLTDVARARRHLEELVESKDQFIASVSHELRTPLTVVVGLAAELAANPERLTTAEIVEFASLISGQATEVASLVEDLLTMARADAGVLSIAPETIDLQTVVQDVLTGLPGDLRERVSRDVGESSLVYADPVRVRQIVRNLFTNAGRHGGPSINVEVSGTVIVRDDGQPVPESERERMFMAYERVHDYKGKPDSVGLGLTVCRRLSQLMGGDVTYDHDGEWSVFTVTLPAV